MTAKKPDLYKAPEDEVVLRYEMSTVPLQDQVGYMRHWGARVHQNGLASWNRMKETSATSRNKLTDSLPAVPSFIEPQSVTVGLAGVLGLLLARKKGTVRRVLYPTTAIGVTLATMWLTYAHNRKLLSDYCHKIWNDFVKR